MLHGPPGVGKTTSAEAVAEVLKRPLYSVTVGELGTDAKTLEKSLTRLLQIAGRWNAVILLDEADIFLETRTDNDVLRNAMVGIFLRLLEYHQGVMFLTTNRVKRFDPAFHSRISVALHYDEFDTKTRKQVWTNLLNAANLGDLAKKHAEELSLCKLNGRQIRTTIRMALSLALSDNTTVSFQHIKETIELTQKFSDYLEFAK